MTNPIRVIAVLVACGITVLVADARLIMTDPSGCMVVDPGDHLDYGKQITPKAVTREGLRMCPQGGTASQGLLPYNITCPPGTFVTTFDIAMADSRTFGSHNKSPDASSQVSIDMIFFGPVRCSPDATGASNTAKVTDKTSNNDRPFAALKSRSEIGYTGIDLYTGLRVNAVGPVPFSGRVGSSKSNVQYYMLGGGGEYKSVQCPGGQLVTGLYGQVAEQGVVNVGLLCRRIAGLDSVTASG